jgi:WD40 repeat protein
MWDLVQGKQIRELPGGYPVLSPDGSSVIVTTFTDDKRSLIALDTKTGKELWTSDRRPWLHDIRFAADGRSIAFYEGKRTTQFLDAGAGKTAQTLPFRVSAASPDLKQVLTSKGEYWDVATNTMLWSTEVDVRWLEASRFQAGGKRLLVATSAQTEDKNCVFVLDLATGKTVRSVGGGSDHQFSPDGRAVAYRAYEKDCYGFEVCDLDTGKVVLRRQVDGGVRPKYCAFSLDGRLFACSTSDEVFEFYDMRTGKRLGLPRKHWAYIHSLTFSPDGKTLAVSYNDSTILFWEAPRPTP